MFHSAFRAFAYKVLFSLSSIWALRRLLRRERCRLHHHARLPAGVSPPPELSLGHHGPRAFATHRPQLQPALWNRETGLQVRAGCMDGGKSCTRSKKLELKSFVFSSRLFVPESCWVRSVNFGPLSFCFSGFLSVIIITLGPPLVPCL